MSILNIPVLIRGRHIWDEYQMPPEEFEARREAVRKAMKEKKLDGLIFFSDSLCNSHVEYLTFYHSMVTWANAMMLFTIDGEIRIIAAAPPRDIDRVLKFMPPGIQVDLAGLSLVSNDHIGAKAVSYLEEKGLLDQNWAGVNLEHAPYQIYHDLKNKLGRIEDFTEEFENLRNIKSKAELSLISQAAALARTAALELARKCTAGVSEYAAAAEVSRQIRYAGAEDIRVLIGTGKGDKDFCLHFPTEHVFQSGDRIKIYVQVQYLRYHGIFGLTVPADGAEDTDKNRDKQKQIQKEAEDQFAEIICRLETKRAWSPEDETAMGITEGSFTSIKGIGMDISENLRKTSDQLRKNSDHGFSLNSGNVIAVTLDRRNGCFLADTFLITERGLASLAKGF